MRARSFVSYYNVALSSTIHNGKWYWTSVLSTQCHPRIHKYTDVIYLFEIVCDSVRLCFFHIGWVFELIVVFDCVDFRVYSHNAIIQLKMVCGTHLQMTWFWLLLLLFRLLSVFFFSTDFHLTLHWPTRLFIFTIINGNGNYVKKYDLKKPNAYHSEMKIVLIFFSFSVYRLK